MQENNDFLKYVPIFSELDDSTLDQISKLGIRKSFVKDSVVLLSMKPDLRFCHHQRQSEGIQSKR